MAQLFANAARSLLMAGISAVETNITLELAKADLFPVADTGTDPVPTVGKDWFKVVLQDNTGAIEIIYVRTRTAGSASMTNCLRGQDGTTAIPFLGGSIVELRHVAADLAEATSFATGASSFWKTLVGWTTAALSRTALGATAVGDAVFTAASALAGRTAIGAAALDSSDTTAIAAGTADAITADFTPNITTLTNGLRVTVTGCSPNTIVNPTLAPDAIAAAEIVKSGGVALAVADIPAVADFVWSSALSKWVLMNPANPVTTPIDSAVQGASKNLRASATGTSATISISADEIVVKNASNAYFTMRDVAVAASLAASGANGLDDSVPTTVTITIASPGVITETAHGRPANAPVVLATTGALPTGLTAGTTYYVTNPTTNGYSLSATKGGAAINTTGSQSGVHTVKSVLAVSSWYSKWVIWNGTTKAALLSSSETNPVLPSGYTHKARTGWVYTDTSGNKYPLGFKQTDRKTVYVIGSGTNVTALPMMASGALGNVAIPTWVAVATGNYVPPTAVQIMVTIWQMSSNAAAAAPNNAYGAMGSTTNPPPLAHTGGGASGGSRCDLTLESTNIYYVSSSASGGLQCCGWEDNL